jgi:hypothetical protein
MLAGLLIAQPGPAAAEAESRVFGTPSLRPTVDARTRPIYDAAAKPDSPRTFLFTSDDLLGVAEAVGTDASGVSAGPAGTRMVATVWSKRGKYLVEYYRSRGGDLLFVYETFVYFSDKAPSGAWRNFMGQAGWERRSYFHDDGTIGFAESKGRHAPAPGAGAPELREQARRLAAALAERTSAP